MPRGIQVPSNFSSEERLRDHNLKPVDNCYKALQGRCHFRYGKEKRYFSNLGSQEEEEEEQGGRGEGAVQKKRCLLKNLKLKISIN